MIKLSAAASTITITSLLSFSKKLGLSPQFTGALSKKTVSPSIMSINLDCHAFAGNPFRLKSPKEGDPFSPINALETLKSRLLETTRSPSSPGFMILPFRRGSPLASSCTGNGDSTPIWHLGWVSLDDFQALLASSEVQFSGDSLVYLGSRVEDDVIYWAMDVSDDSTLPPELVSKRLSFVELRTLMVATDWADAHAMGELAIAGHARALLEWHNISRFCGHCGHKTVPMEAGRRKQCSNESCRKRIYPRVDPVVIMLVIDRENDRALLSRQSRFVPRMWSCLAGFIEILEDAKISWMLAKPLSNDVQPGESLEEAVRRETWEETGIEVGEVVYHSSQPWPVGPNSMPCQLMAGFYAYAKSLEINVDKQELEDAKWHSREEVRKALTFTEYKKAQQTAAARIEQMCKGVETSKSFATDFNVESGELATMFVPGPFAIAHHLISSWAHRDGVNGVESRMKNPSVSGSNL